ncbi:MAG: sugar ABC transporter ATP-binding protein [Ancalomicrobiaceae bacterium]|nr:sugar ABC transporter ATP-binding protein [Ancalomicrobiaceae bacterium]
MASHPLAETGNSFIRIEHVSKSFVGVNALTDVSFAIARGQAVNLVGENGSGKSTLIKILAGAETPDEGAITVDAEVHASLDPRQSVARGIQVIFQDFSLFPNLSVAENIAFSLELAEGRTLVRRRHMRATAERVLERIGVTIDLDIRVEKLSVADKQLVAIARALASEARLIIMDEPTTALTEREVRSLIAIIRRLKADGIAVLFVSHKLTEGLEVCEKVVVLRNGHLVADAPASEFDAGSLAYHMTGRRLAETAKPPLAKSSPAIMSVRGLSRAGVLREICFDLAHGEVLGIAGLLGSGRTELAKALFGLIEVDAGKLLVDGKRVPFGSVHTMIEAGIGYVPEDRLTEGLFLPQSISRNVTIGTIDSHAGRGGVLDRSGLRAQVSNWLARLNIATSDSEAAVQSLSGGNQQRVVLARWLAKRPKVLILNGPTVGVDVGSKTDIHAIIAELAASGLGIIVISDDIPEVLASCNRILVMKAGQIAEEIPGASIKETELARRLMS